MVASPDLQGELSLTAAGLGAALFSVPLLVGTLVEPVLLAWSSRYDRRGVLAAALVAMALTQALVAWAGDAVLLTLAVAAWGIGSGVSTSLAEVALVARGGDTHRAMTRWALLGSLGDLAAPLAYAACAGLGLGWRVALLLGAALALLDAAAVAAGPPLREGGDDDADDDERVSYWAAARSPAVWVWLLAAAACTLFDEILVAYGALWLDAGGASPVLQGVAVATFSVGTATGHVVSDRLLARWSPRTVLLSASALCVLVWPLWLALPAGMAVWAGLLVGFAVAPMWSIATAEAYAAAPRPSVVAALSRVLGPLDLVAPLAIGLVADRFGLLPAMLVLLAQPVVVAAAACWGRRK